MKAVMKIAIGAVGVAALVGGAAPAAAQYYPGNPYGHNQPGNVIGQVISQVLNPYGNQYGGQYGGQYGNQYGGQQVAVQQCTAAVQQRLRPQYRGGYGGQSPYGYNTAQSNARVLGITRVEQRSRSMLRVRGVATSGMAYGGYGQPGYGSNPYGGQAGYGGYAQAPADLTFRCDVDYHGRIRDVDIDRRR